MIHEMVGQAQVIEIASAQQNSGQYFLAKRCLDVMIAVALLTLLAPVFLLIAVLIKLDSPGPVFFLQERVGARRRTGSGRTTWEVRIFQVYKFRSMVQNADQSLHEAHIRAYASGTVAPEGNTVAPFKISGDARITRVGNILRKTSLDELPQLVNVVIGEMSLVGPRPVPTYEVAEYQPWQMERIAALPGITGQWQVHGRGRVTFEEQIRMDIDYVRNPSLRRDITLLVQTIPAVLSARGAQ